MNLLNNYQKKAQAQIITTILIILLVLAAIVIVWQVVNSTIQEGADEISDQSSCLGLRVEVTKVDLGVGEIVIRPNKDINGYRVYINGEEEFSTDADVEALKTVVVSTSSGTLSTGDEIEVIPILGETACQGSKETVK